GPSRPGGFPTPQNPGRKSYAGRGGRAPGRIRGHDAPDVQERPGYRRYQSVRVGEDDRAVQAGRLLRGHQGKICRPEDGRALQAAPQLRHRRPLRRIRGSGQLLPRDRPPGQHPDLEDDHPALAGEEERRVRPAPRGARATPSSASLPPGTRGRVNRHHERGPLSFPPPLPSDDLDRFQRASRGEVSMLMGAMYAALGVHACLPHSHGSQGCCAYHRSMLTRHFREPVMSATSSFTEGSSVFGGQSNLLAAIENIFTIYNPTVIGVHTTCLSETIGDDMNQIITKARDDGKIPEGKYVFHANTPSYVGSHVTGFARMTKAMVDYYAEHDGIRNETINLIPGWVEPSDIRELKRLVAEMKLECITFPDQSDVFDTPQTGKMNMYPKGGVTVPLIKAAGNSEATIGLGPTASGLATEALEVKCKVPGQLLELPVGLRATDRFIAALRHFNGRYVPDSIID